jgi:hypothetical protein
MYENEQAQARVHREGINIVNVVYHDIPSEALAHRIASREFMRGIENALGRSKREPMLVCPKFFVPIGGRYGGYYAYISVQGPIRTGVYFALEGRMWRVVSVRRFFGSLSKVVLFDGQNTRFYTTGDGEHFHRYVPA